MEGVGGVLLDESVVLGSDDSNGTVFVLPEALYLLGKLRYSTITTGLSFGSSFLTHKVRLLKSIAILHSCNCFLLDASSINSSVNEIKRALCGKGGSILYVVSDIKKDTFFELSNHGWRIVISRSAVQKYPEGSSSDIENGNTSECLSVLHIDRLEALVLTICRLNKMTITNAGVTVGFIMKPSREEDFAKRGAFPMYPTQNGLIFMPFSFDLPISSQLKEVDVILHKATDEIISIELANALESSHKITFTRGMHELVRYMELHPDRCTVDPLKNIYPVLDRLKIQDILHGLEELNRKDRSTIRGAHFLKVDTFNNTYLMQRFSELKLSLPSIVKPQVACGVADAHSMAIIFRFEDVKDLSIPLPAIVQEYVDHSSSIFKIYVLGERVFHAVKKSTPNAAILIKLSEENGFKPLLFDSLKSLPIQKDSQYPGDKVSSPRIDLDLVTDAAYWLRKRLDLTIFGFDVVIQEGTGDHVIVDLNYLPSFKEVPDDIAIPAFWDAIKTRFENELVKQARLKQTPATST